MKSLRACACLPQFLVIWWVFLLTHATGAAEFNDQQFQAVNTILRLNAGELQQQADSGLDFALGLLGRAFEQSAYGRSAPAENARKQLAEDAAALKTRIRALQARIPATGTGMHNPASAVMLLAEEQHVAFQLYRWFRTLVEMTDMANASAHREEAGTGEYFRKTMANFEDMEDLLSDTISRVAGKVLGGT